MLRQPVLTLRTPIGVISQISELWDAHDLYGASSAQLSNTNCLQAW